MQGSIIGTRRIPPGKDSGSSNVGGQSNPWSQVDAGDDQAAWSRRLNGSGQPPNHARSHAERMAIAPPAGPVLSSSDARGDLSWEKGICRRHKAVREHFGSDLEQA